MKLYISADIEGTVGCTDWAETEQGNALYERQVKEMQREVAAACRGALAGGADEIYIKDAHDSALNLSYEGLPKEAHLIRGWMSSPESMVAGVDESFDGAIFIGYHSPAYSAESPLAHTSSFSKFTKVTMNGELMSEFDLYGLACAAHGVPVLFLAGDEGICRIAEARGDGIRTVTTKYGVAGATVNEHPDVIEKAIEEGVRQSVFFFSARVRKDEKLVMELTFRDHKNAQRGAWYPGAERVDAHTVRYEARDIRDFLTAYMFIQD